MRSSVLAGAAALLAACAGLPKAPAPTNPVRLLSVNDLAEIDTLPNGDGGLARLATLRRRIAGEGPVLTVVAGNFLGPSLASRYFGGAQMVEVLNAAGIDYVTFGGHDLDLPPDSLQRRIAAATFKWLSANCTAPDSSAMPGVLAWDTVQVHGHKVGLFGLTARLEAKGARCTDPDAAARAAIDTLGKLGADLIVAVTHQSLDADLALLGREGQLELVLGGSGRRAATVQVGARHVVTSDANARSAQFVTLWGKKGEWRQATRVLDVRPNLTPDRAVQRLVEAWRDSVATRLGPDALVGMLADSLDATDATLRSTEAPFGDIVTDAMRIGTGADAALINAGAMRLDAWLPPGPLRRYTLESLFLFADETRVVVVPMTGGRLREMLERGVSDGVAGTGGFLQVSGLRYTVDRGHASGARLAGQLTNSDNRLIATTDRIRVALPTYLACAGGDGYRVPEAAAACAAAANAPRAADLLARHIAERLGGRVSPPPPGRITLR
ncbi:MAG TPA: 5'-nucleotidase C-terminal domain-containing protein [Gemmatimonadales bacterium]|nr:5'-nucleotidase C-terminal domain-containing protein [Gemmatimonadales bacterium]